MGLLDAPGLTAAQGDLRYITAATADAKYVTSALSPLYGYFADLAQARTKRVNVLMCGDSIYEGLKQASVSARWINQAEQLLRARFANSTTGGEYIPAQYLASATGSLPFFPAWTFTGTTADFSQGLGLKAKSLNVGATATITRTCTSFDVYLRRSNGAGTTVKVTVDGVVQPTWTLSNITHNKWSSGPLTAGSHTVIIEPLTGSSGPVLCGGYFYNGDETAGLSLWDGSRSGARADSFNTGTDWIAQAAFIGNFSLAVLGWLTNDSRTVSGGYSSANYNTQMRGIIDKLRTSIPNLPILIMTPYEAVDTLIEPWKNYTNVLKQIAADYSYVSFYDLSVPIPYLGSDPYGLTNAATSDTIHPTNKGAALLATLAATSAMAPR